MAQISADIFRAHCAGSIFQGDLTMIVVQSAHGVRFTLSQYARLSRAVVSVLSCHGQQIYTFADEQDRLIVRHADGYYADEFGFTYDALYLVELNDGNAETSRIFMDRVITVKQPMH